MGVSDLGNGVDVRNIAVGIAQGLQIDGLRVGPDCSSDGVQIMGIHESSRYTKLGQGVGHQIVAAAIDGLLCHDVIPRLGQGLNSVGDRRCAGSQSQSRHAALQGRKTLFQNILGRVSQTPIDVPGVRQTETSGGMGGITENI